MIWLLANGYSICVQMSVQQSGQSGVSVLIHVAMGLSSGAGDVVEETVSVRHRASPVTLMTATLSQISEVLYR